MLLTIQNDELSLSVETYGAQMMSLCSATGIEYLWQGDPAYWADRAPVLFPYIARLTDDSYCYEGMRYRMGIHGFAAASEFIPEVHTDEKLVLVLSSSDHTLKQYPFQFQLKITYTLSGRQIGVSYQVINESEKIMPFAIGGHPGFRVPLEPNEQFEDYRLEFGCNCQPDRVGFTPSLFLSGEDRPYTLKDDRYLELRHELFDNDAIVLKNMAKSVKLYARKTKHSVKLEFQDFPYLGIWHVPCRKAPYVCLEPWSSLPSRQDIVEEISCKSDLLQLAPGKTYNAGWKVTVT